MRSARKWLIIGACALVSIPMCGRQTLSVRIPELSPQERKAAALPQAGELVLAGPADESYTATLGEDVRQALGDFLRPQNVKWRITAARPVGDFLLLWVAFPEIADGGIDLIYSRKTKKIVGGFLGGYRG